MKTAIFFILLLLMSMPVLAEQVNYNEFQEATLDIGLGSDMEILEQSSSASIDYLDVFLSFYPRETDQQSIVDFRTTPKATEENRKLHYRWNFPTQKELAFSVSSTVNVNGDFTRVKSKIKFPIEKLPEEYVVYTQPSENIDSDNEKIIKTASSIAEGEDDLYEVAFTLARWVETNVQYSLDTLTADVSQPASWVLEEKRGVCDELTTLYIALLRSLGVPARFISGVAYTNWNNLNDWGPHAWAEVYFPGYGWVPFDLTYNQFGSIDASHIVLKQSIDSNEATADYEWKGRDVDIKTRTLDIAVKLGKVGTKKEPSLVLDAEPIYKSIGFGSFNVVETTLENLHDYYLPVVVSMAKLQELQVLDGSKKQVLLKPFEKKKVYWIVRIQENLPRNLIYTIPLIFYTDIETNTSTSFITRTDEPTYSLDDVKSIVKEKEEEQQKEYSENIDLFCSTSEEEYYLEDDILLECSIKNIGNKYLENIELCAMTSCKSIDLGITQEKTIDLRLQFNQSGKTDIAIKASHKDLQKTVYHRLTMLDKPSIYVDNLHFPETVHYQDSYNISFSVKKTSMSNPLQVSVLLDNGGAPKEWIIDELRTSEEFIITLRGKDLRMGENEFSILTHYYDKKGNRYDDNVTFSLALVDVTFGQRIVIFFNGIGRAIERFFAGKRGE